MTDIVLAALNAKYIHGSFGARYLLANLGPLINRATLEEFDIKRSPAEIAEAILAHEPRIVGLGVYIWNVEPATELVAELKRRRPETVIVLGGPEVSVEGDEPPICDRADFVIAGEGEFAFAALCEQLLDVARPAKKFIRSGPADPERLALPYELYSDKDLATRMIYAETSRGCPFQCEYCISANDAPVRFLPLPRVLDALRRVLDRGGRGFKFVDRTFNANLPRAMEVLGFLRPYAKPGLSFHFEMMPDRFPLELIEAIRSFPPGVIRLEIGVQTFHEDVARRIGRRQDMEKAESNLRQLRETTGAILHADLIAGLPGESFESFAAGFDRLAALRPHEIQLGILKRLRGAAITRHDGEWEMVYNARPPYEVLHNRLIDAEGMQRLNRFARFWEMAVNSGNFLETAPRIWAGAPSVFAAFMRWCDWMNARLGRAHAIPLVQLAEELLAYLTGELGNDRAATAAAMLRDYRRNARREVPGFLRSDTRLPRPVL